MSNIFPASLDEREVLNDLCQNIELVSCAQNTILFLQGQPATSYFIIFSGAVEILQTQNPEQQSYLLRKYAKELMKSLGPKFTKTTLGTYLCSLPENKGFGELALIKEGGTRATAALIQRPTEMIEVGPELYARTIKPFHVDQANVGDIYKFLQDCPLCEGMSGRNLTNIAYKIQKAKFPIHHALVYKGEKIEDILLIEKGEVKQVGVIEGVHVEIAVRGAGLIIGASELLHDHTHQAFSYEAVTAVEGYRMPLECFELLRQNRNAVKSFFRVEEEWKKLHQSRGTEKLAKVAMAVATGANKDLPSLLARDLVKLDQKEKEEQLAKKAQAKLGRGRAKSVLHYVLDPGAAAAAKQKKKSFRHSLAKLQIIEDGFPRQATSQEHANTMKWNPAVNYRGSSQYTSSSQNNTDINQSEATGKNSVLHIMHPPNLKATRDRSNDGGLTARAIQDQQTNANDRFRPQISKAHSLMDLKTPAGASSIGDFWSSKQATPKSNPRSCSSLNPSLQTASSDRTSHENNSPVMKRCASMGNTKLADSNTPTRTQKNLNTVNLSSQSHNHGHNRKKSTATFYSVPSQASQQKPRAISFQSATNLPQRKSSTSQQQKKTLLHSTSQILRPSPAPICGFPSISGKKGLP